MANKLKRLAAKLKVKKSYLLHWLLVLILGGFFLAMVANQYTSKDKNTIQAAKENKLIVLDVATGQQVDPAILTTPKDKAKPAETAAPKPDKPAQLMVIISNLGLNKNDAEKAISLPKEFILSFSPYAENSLELSQEAKISDHTVLVDLPMQMKNPDDKPGNLALLVENTDFKNSNNLNAVLSKAYHPSGVLTPQGDIFTRSNNFIPVLQELAKRKLFVAYAGDSDDIDSKAKDNDIELLKIDTIIDETKSASIADQLQTAETMAGKAGLIVILIKNPSAQALAEITKWDNGLAQKNIQVISSGR